MNIVLISTYELGRQPFGLASPAAWLKDEGAQVTCLDLAVEELNEEAIRSADLVAFYIPMHTATRIASQAVHRIRELNSSAHLCFYGLYAAMNTEFLKGLGAETLISGEFEEGLVELYRQLQSRSEKPQLEKASSIDVSTSPVSLNKLQFRIPDRTGLPSLNHYATLRLPNGEERTVGYTEASRGCKHLCRHCPVVPVYQGNFRIVQKDVVLADIRNQVAAGARHITFGDPDFFNGIGHALSIVNALHQEFPALTYDITIKVEHLLKHHEHLPVLRDTGCAFVITAVESLEDHILKILDKGHTEEDFYKVVELFKEVELTLSPTFVTFTPWITGESYLYLLRRIADLNLTENVAPIQLAIRLLIPTGSYLLKLPEVQAQIGEFDPVSLSYQWQHPDPRMDELQKELSAYISQQDENHLSRTEIFEEVWSLACRKLNTVLPGTTTQVPPRQRVKIPYLTEPWYC